MKIRLKERLADIEAFERNHTLTFNLDVTRNDMNMIKESILSIQNNLKHHINMFSSVDNSKNKTASVS